MDECGQYNFFYVIWCIDPMCVFECLNWQLFSPSSATLELENRLADFSPKSAQNTQSLRAHPELRSPSKPFARPVPSTQSTVSSSLAMLDEVPVFSGNKKLGRPGGICDCCIGSIAHLALLTRL